MGDILVAGPGNKGKSSPVVEHIIDLDEFGAVLFDEANVAVLLVEVNLDRYMMFVMIPEVCVLENQLTVQIHRRRSFNNKFFGFSLPSLYI
jgi:hypothetical protein